MKTYSLKDFLPLILIFGCVILITYILTLWRGVSTESVMTDFMGSFFLIFGGFKVINVQGFAKAYQKYDLLARVSKPYALAYPFIELTVAALYLSQQYLYWTNIFTLTLMLFSAAGVYNELQKKNEIQCACLGVLFKVPMTWVTLIEDLLMAGMALFMLL